VETAFVQAGSVRLQYFTHGNGPTTALFVHGHTSSGRGWRLTQEALDPARYRTIAISNRGAGDSDRTPHEADYSVETFASDLEAARQTLGLQRFVLVGHSMGGATAASFALTHQDLVNALILVDPAPLNGFPLPEGWEQRVRNQHERAAERGTEVGSSDRQRAPGVPDDFYDALDADVARNSLERLMGGWRSMAALRLHDRLTELQRPTLVVGGDHDTTVPIDSILADFQVLPREIRSLHVFYGAGHSPHVEFAADFAAILDRFVTDHAEA